MPGRKRIGNNSLELLKNVGERVKRQAKKDSTKEHRNSEDLTKEESAAENSIPNIGIPNIGILKIGIPNKSYCKVHNWIFDDLPKILSTSEWVVYIHLYRLSLGYQKESCIIGYGGLAKRTGLSRNTVIKAIKNLIEKEYIIDGESGQGGTPFIVGVPNNGIPKIGIPDLGMPLEGIPKNDIPSMPNTGIPTDGTPVENTDNKGDRAGVPNLGIPKTAPIKYNNKNIIKNNNKTVLLLFSSKTINLPEPTIYNLIKKVDHKIVEKWIKFIEDKKEEIDNPSGFFRCAIEQNWEIPLKWEKSYKKKKEMEKQAKEEEEKIAREKTEWESWLISVSEDLMKAAEAYADNEMEAAIRKPKSEETRQAMWNGFIKHYLREKFEEQKAT